MEADLTAELEVAFGVELEVGLKEILGKYYPKKSRG